MTEPAPIIIIGAARSGTKFLRDVLASGSGAACVPYDVNYVWRYRVGWERDDVLDPSELTDARRAFIRESLSRIARQRSGQRIVEKTVANTLRVPFVNAVYPDAVFVHLIRDGRDVTESAMRQWSAAPGWSGIARKAREIPLRNLDYVAWYAFNTLAGLFSGRKGGRVWGPRYPGIQQDVESLSLVEVCARQWNASVTSSLRDLAGIPAVRVREIRYEDLVGGPEALDSLIEWLGLPDKDQILSAWRSRRAPPEQCMWTRLPEEERSRMLAITGPTLARLGYAP